MGLNALSGIGGVQTVQRGVAMKELKKRLNALSGIGGVQTIILKKTPRPEFPAGLNALSGIGGVQTRSSKRRITL